MVSNRYFCTMKQYNKVVLSLGSNLGDKKAYLSQAIDEIHKRIGFVAEISALYETPSWGFDSFPFYNVCLLLHTHLDVYQLLNRLKNIEKELGRSQKTDAVYSARTVDIDIVYFNNQIIDRKEVTVPHPRMKNRKFVLIPLNDLSVDWKHPLLQQTTSEMITSCTDDSKIERIGKIAIPKDKLSLSACNLITIEGNIGSGKTSLTQKIAQDFHAKMILERYAENPFLPKFYQKPKRYAFQLEMSFLVDRYAQLNEDLAQFDLFNEFIVSDYYIYKSLIFAQVTLENDEFRLYRTLFDIMYKQIQKPNLFVFLLQNTEKLLENIQKRGRDFEYSIAADYLNKINQGYADFIKTLPAEQVLIIDCNDLDFVEKHEDYLNILMQIEKHRSSISNR